jgi:hypothetical protein
MWLFSGKRYAEEKTCRKMEDAEELNSEYSSP